MSDLFNTGHVAQLHEIQRARLRHGERGIGPEVEELIMRLTSGGVAGASADLRVIRAKRLFDLGLGRELEMVRFEDYLATIPAIPDELLIEDPDFPHLVLVESRIGVTRLCRLGNITFSGDDQTLVPWDERHQDSTSPVWIRMQDGRRNRDRKVRDCRVVFAPDELGFTALEGVCSYLELSSVVEELRDNQNGHAMDLPGSVHRDNRDYMANLRVNKGQAILHWHWSGHAYPNYGSASRRRMKMAA